MVKYYIYFLITIFCYINEINSYLIFPLEYLPNEIYKFIENENSAPDQLMKQIYYSNFITHIKIGSPTQMIPLLIQTNSDKFYISSVNPSDNPTEKEQHFYLFSKDEYYNEKDSSTYKTGNCFINQFDFNPYDEICESNETINLNINDKNKKTEFPITLVRNINENVPGYLGLLYNDLEFDTTKNIITNSKYKKLIDNYNWFFDFDEFDPLNKKLKGNLIIGGEPHEFYPKKYPFEDLESTSSYKTGFTGRSWRLLIDKIFIDNSNSISIPSRIITFNYEIYNIITTMEFHNLIKKLIMDELIENKKCFISNFTQNLYKDFDLTFYYCDKTTKDALYGKIPNLKFTSSELNYIFELTKEELFYEKDDYIYFMVLFSNEPTNNWIMGQMFTKKYNFCFHNDNKQIQFYKKINHGAKRNTKSSDKSHKISNAALITIISIGEAIIFIVIGLMVGRYIFGIKKKKIRVNELDNEVQYNIKENNEITNTSDQNNLENDNKNEEDKSIN